MSHISDNLTEIRELMAAAAERSGRKPWDTTLLVVSKTFPPEAIREAAEYTEPIFAESRVTKYVRLRIGLG